MSDDSFKNSNDQENIAIYTTNDGTTYKVDHALCNQIASNTIEDLWACQDKIENYDFATTVFGIYTECIRVLAHLGCTQVEMIQEVINHGDPHEELCEDCATEMDEDHTDVLSSSKTSNVIVH